MEFSVVGGIILSLTLSVYSSREEEENTDFVFKNLKSLNDSLPALTDAIGQNITLTFFESALGDIPSDFFKSKNITELYFENCEIGSFGTRPFTGLENTLKKLYIDNSVDYEEIYFETLPLGHLKKLEELSFEGNYIRKLGNDWFNGGPKPLKILFLESSGIKELGDRAFASLVNIEQIWFGTNAIKKVSRSMFPRPANNLSLLDIGFNNYTALPEDMFEDMPALEIIDVSGNQLQTVPKATWGKIWNQLKEVNLERNSGFICDQRIKWIYRRKLPNSLRGECPYSTNKNFSRKKLYELKLCDFE